MRAHRNEQRCKHANVHAHYQYVCLYQSEKERKKCHILLAKTLKLFVDGVCCYCCLRRRRRHHHRLEMDVWTSKCYIVIFLKFNLRCFGFYLRFRLCISLTISINCVCVSVFQAVLFFCWKFWLCIIIFPCCMWVCLFVFHSMPSVGCNE